MSIKTPCASDLTFDFPKWFNQQLQSQVTSFIPVLEVTSNQCKRIWNREMIYDGNVNTLLPLTASLWLMIIRAFCYCKLRSHWTSSNQSPGFAFLFPATQGKGSVEKGKKCAGIKRGVTHCGRSLPRVRGGQESRVVAECEECCLQTWTLRTSDHGERYHLRICRVMAQGQSYRMRAQK